MNRRLTLEETYKCLKAWKELKDKEAYELLIKCNSGLVVFIAKKYLGRGLNFNELVSAGNLGLLNAINKFNYEDNSIKAFSTYIGTSIENAIRVEITNYNKHKDVLSFNEPIICDEDNVGYKILEETIGTDEKTVEEDVLEKITSNVVRQALTNLTERERKIIYLRFGLDNGENKTLDEVAKIYNTTIPKIVEEERKILRKIRHPKYSKKLRDFLD